VLDSADPSDAELDEFIGENSSALIDEMLVEEYGEGILGNTDVDGQEQEQQQQQEQEQEQMVVEKEDAEDSDDLDDAAAEDQEAEHYPTMSPTGALAQRVAEAEEEATREAEEEATREAEEEATREAEEVATRETEEEQARKQVEEELAKREVEERARKGAEKGQEEKEEQKQDTAKREEDKAKPEEAAIPLWKQKAQEKAQKRASIVAELPPTARAGMASPSSPNAPAPAGDADQGITPKNHYDSDDMEYEDGSDDGSEGYGEDDGVDGAPALEAAREEQTAAKPIDGAASAKLRPRLMELPQVVLIMEQVAARVKRDVEALLEQSSADTSPRGSRSSFGSDRGSFGTGGAPTAAAGNPFGASAPGSADADPTSASDTGADASTDADASDPNQDAVRWWWPIARAVEEDGPNEWNGNVLLCLLAGWAGRRHLRHSFEEGNGLYSCLRRARRERHTLDMGVEKVEGLMLKALDAYRQGMDNEPSDDPDGSKRAKSGLGGLIPAQWAGRVQLVMAAQMLAQVRSAMQAIVCAGEMYKREVARMEKAKEADAHARGLGTVIRSPGQGAGAGGGAGADSFDDKGDAIPSTVIQRALFKAHALEKTLATRLHQVYNVQVRIGYYRGGDDENDDASGDGGSGGGGSGGVSDTDRAATNQLSLSAMLEPMVTDDYIMNVHQGLQAIVIRLLEQESQGDQVTNPL
jgi:hypothetical protein